MFHGVFWLISKHFNSIVRTPFSESLFHRVNKNSDPTFGVYATDLYGLYPGIRGLLDLSVICMHCSIEVAYLLHLGGRLVEDMLRFL